MEASFSLYSRSGSSFPNLACEVGVDACPGEAGVFSEDCGEGALLIAALPAGDIIGILCTEAGLFMFA